MPAGRPKITLDDLPENWQNDVIELGKEGGSDVEIYAGILGIADKTFSRLLADEPEFLRIITRARQLSELWWTKHSRKELHNKDFNNKLYEMNMMNRFGWNKKTETTVKDTKRPRIKWSDDND